MTDEQIKEAYWDSLKVVRDREDRLNSWATLVGLDQIKYFIELGMKLERGEL